MDDIVIFWKTFPDNTSQVRDILERIASAGIRLSLNKGRVACNEDEVLGRIASKEGINVDFYRIRAIADTPAPQSKIELGTFQGPASYYRRFIKNSAKYAGALHAANTPRAGYAWTNQMEAAFTEFRRRLCKPPTLACPNLHIPFIVESDASSFVVGSLLAREDENGKVHAVKFASQTMNTAEQNYKVSEKEALTVVLSLKKFRHYFQTVGKFTVITDHRALRSAFQKKDLHGSLMRWPDLIAKYCLEIIYWNSKASLQAD